MSISVKLVKPPPNADAKVEVFVGKLDVLMGKEEPQQISERNKVTASWKKEKPVFYGVRYRTKTRVGLRVYPGGPSKGKKKWYWLGRGTAVRYAHMTRDFEAKTRRRYIGSLPGKGGFSHIDVNKPLPGIEAREWDKQIAEDRNPIVRQGIGSAWRETLATKVS